MTAGAVIDAEDYFGAMCIALAAPIKGEVDDPPIRAPKPLRRGVDYWEGCFSSAGRPRLVGKTSRSGHRNLGRKTHLKR